MQTVRKLLSLDRVVTRSEQGLQEGDLNAMNEMVWRWEGLEGEEMDSKVQFSSCMF